MTSDTHALRASIQYLEREVRWMKIAGLVLLTLGGGAVLMGQAAPKPQRIEAKEIALHDDDGKLRAFLAVTESGAALDLYDAEENRQVRLYVTKHGSGLHLGDTNEPIRSSLYVNGDGPGLDFYDTDKKLRASLGVTKRGNPGLALRDASENPRVWLTGVTAIDGGPALIVYDSTKNVRGALAVTEKYGPSLDLYDANGEEIWSAP